MRVIFTIFLSVLLSSMSHGTTTTISVSGFSFSNTNVIINTGDTIKFVLSTPHTATEVSESTWNANGATPLSGGFDVGPGGTHIVTGLSVGTHYYVCIPHAGFGMKGRITVNAPSGIHQFIRDGTSIQVFPNPTASFITIQTNGWDFENLEIINILGEVVYSKQNIISTLKLDVSRLSSGIYWIVLSDERQKIVKKIQKN